MKTLEANRGTTKYEGGAGDGRTPSGRQDPRDQRQ